MLSGKGRAAIAYGYGSVEEIGRVAEAKRRGLVQSCHIDGFIGCVT